MRARLALHVFVLMRVCWAVVMRTVMVAAVGVAVKHLHDVQVAEKTEKGSEQHVGGLFYN